MNRKTQTNGMELLKKYNGEPTRFVDVMGKKILLIGTSHTSKMSAEFVKYVIQKTRPEAVCLELCQNRYNAIMFKNKRILSLLNGTIFSKVFSRVMSIFYTTHGDQKDNAQIGSVERSASFAANSVRSKIYCIDKDIDETIADIKSSIGITGQVIYYIMYLIVCLFEKQIIAVLNQFSISESEAKKTTDFKIERKEEKILIEGRNKYMAKKIIEIAEKNIVAIVGAGHLDGMERILKGIYK